LERICVVGAGYVGLTTSACFAEVGNQVWALDIDTPRIEALRHGELPIFEPGLGEMVARNLRNRRLSFTTDYAEAIGQADFVFIAVNTPEGDQGEADMKFVRTAAASIARALRGYTVIINKSTMPVGSGDMVTRIFRREAPRADFAVVANPEFLREGSAIQDFLKPDRVVLGSADRDAARRVATLYRPFLGAEWRSIPEDELPPQVVITDLRTAEMIKYASNAFLATRISFMNEMAAICDRLQADVLEVARGMGMDRRIGTGYLDAGLGYGGSCFPKDVKALDYMASMYGYQPKILRAVMEINQEQRRLIVKQLRDIFGVLEGHTVAIFGLSFKPNTDDLRRAASVDIIQLLQHEGAAVRAYDPVAGPRARVEIPAITVCDDAYSAAAGADAAIICTEWPEFKQIDLARLRAAMARPVLIDGRNLLDPERPRDHGFIYRAVGRGHLADDGRRTTDDGLAFTSFAARRPSPEDTDGD
jgi:UDPglucose 6-dehydrogenase